MTNLARLDRLILGTLIGYSLGEQVHGKPHHIIRMYFKGVKDIVMDEGATRSLKLVHRNNEPISSLMPQIREIQSGATNDSDFASEALRWIGTFWKIDDVLLRHIHISIASTDDMSLLLSRLKSFLTEHEYMNIDQVSIHMYPPLDIKSIFNDILTTHDAVLFALAMLLRGKDLDFETTTLSSINMGGLTAITGGLVGGWLSYFNKPIPTRFLFGIDKDILQLLTHNNQSSLTKSFS